MARVRQFPAPAGRASDPVDLASRRATRATLPPRVALARGRTGLTVASIALGAFAVLFCLVRANRSAAVDAAITMRVQRRKHPWLAGLMRVVSWPGFPPQSRVLPPMIAAVIWGLGYPLEGTFQFLAWGTGFFSALIKQIVRRPRPSHPGIEVALANIGGSSFPSGHVLNYVGVYGFLAYLIHTMVRPRAVRRPLVAILAWLVALVGPSRIYLGHHWPSDVLASYLLGSSYVIGLTALYRRIKREFA